MEVVDSKKVALSYWSIGKFPLLVFLCSLAFFTFVFFFVPVVFNVVLYINTVMILITIFYSILLGFIPVFFLKHKSNNVPKLDKPEPISIIISVFNDAQVLERTLQNLLKLSYPLDDIIIVYSAKSTDRTEEVANEFAEKYDAIRAFPESVSRGFALNLGVGKATHEFLLFLDSDTIIFDGFIERALSHFSDEKIKFVSSTFLGLNTTQNVLTMMGWAMTMNMNFYAVGTNKYLQDINFTGFGGVWRKSALIECGGFDENTTSDEAEITNRMKTNYPEWRGIYDDQLYSYQYYPTDLKSLYIQQHHWTKGNYRYSLRSLRKFKNMGLGQKFIFMSAMFMLIIFPVFVWFSMGMSFVQFFVNFFQPNFQFGGGLFYLVLGVISSILIFGALFMFAYPKHRGKSHAFLSRKFILAGIFIIMYISGILYGIVSLNALKDTLSRKKKEKEFFIKMDKSNLQQDDTFIDAAE